MTFDRPLPSPREILRSALADEAGRSELASDPAGVLARHGYEGFTASDVAELMRAFADSVPTDVAMALDGFGTDFWDPLAPFPASELVPVTGGFVDAGLIGLDADSGAHDGDGSVGFATAQPIDAVSPGEDDAPDALDALDDAALGLDGLAESPLDGFESEFGPTAEGPDPAVGDDPDDLDLL